MVKNMKKAARLLRNLGRASSSMTSRQVKSNRRDDVKNPVYNAPAAIGEVVASSALGRDVKYRVRNKEFVTTLTNAAHTGFYVIPESVGTPGLDINPGNVAMFPWLSNIARNFEKYAFRSFTVRVVCSSPTSAEGRYYLNIDYDWDDAVPTTKQEMMLTQTAIEAPVWQGLTMPCSLKAMHADMPYKYVQHGLRVDPEPRTLYCGFVAFATDTTVANCKFDLWIDYDVEFVNPQYVPNTTFDYWNPSASFTSTSNVTVSGTSGYSRVVEPLVRIVGEAVKSVIPGINGVPAMSVNGAASGYALDLGRCFYGLYQAVCELTETGQTPNTILGKATKLAATVYDENGTLLGNVDEATSGGSVTWGPKNYTEAATASAKYRTTLSVVFDQLRETFPTAKYLIPALYSTSAVGAGSYALGELLSAF